MLTIFSSLLPIFILIAAGFGLRKSGLIPEPQWHGIERLTFYVLMPTYMITLFLKSSLDLKQAAFFAFVLLLSISAVTLLVWLSRRPLTRWLGVDGPAFTSVFQTTARWNGFVALAIADKLFGVNGMGLLAVAFVVMVPLTNVTSILVLSAYASKEPAPVNLIVKSVFQNPIIWGLVIGITLKLSNLYVPETIVTTFDLTGRGTLGVMLLALGAGLSWRAVKRSGTVVMLNTFIKLFLAPSIAMGLGLVFGLSGLDLVILVLAMAVPTAVNGFILARTMGGDAELYAATLTMQVIVSFLSLPLFLWWAMQIPV